MSMDKEELGQLLEGVERFARERVGAASARPESPIGPELLLQLTREAVELGVLPPSTTGEGYGIWEHRDDPHAMAFNTGVLRRIAHANPGVAFAWHRMGLARFIATQLGLSLEPDELQGTLLAPTGHYGLARHSLARWLAAAELRDEDRIFMTDWLDRYGNATTIYGRQNWTRLLWPIWCADRIAWQHVERAALDVSAEDSQHGLDELSCFVVRQGEILGEIIETDMENSRLTYARVLKMEMLGLLAIGAGALDRGQKMARDYAQAREQGGQAIGNYPAVQHMLSDIQIARHNVDMALSVFARPIDELDVGALAATRASMSPELCHAANQVMQVYGGIGYTRDAGPEKLVRDQNMLKLMSGGAREIHTFLAAWTGAHS